VGPGKKGRRVQRSKGGYPTVSPSKHEGACWNVEIVGGCEYIVRDYTEEEYVVFDEVVANFIKTISSTSSLNPPAPRTSAGTYLPMGSQNVVNRLLEHIECAICCCPLVTDFVCIPCSHTFDRVCLERWTEERLQGGLHFSCPSCRQEFRIPRGGFPGPSRQPIALRNTIILLNSLRLEESPDVA